MNKEFLGRGWRFPFGFDPGTGAVATSAAERNIEESITIVLGTRPGERQMLPEFGCRIHELVFAPATRATASLAAHHVREALARFEPRIEVTDVVAAPGAGGALRLTVHYCIKSTAELHELDLVLHG